MKAAIQATRIKGAVRCIQCAEEVEKNIYLQVYIASIDSYIASCERTPFRVARCHPLRHDVGGLVVGVGDLGTGGVVFAAPAMRTRRGGGS